MSDILTADSQPWMSHPERNCGQPGVNPDAWFPSNAEVAEKEAPRLCGGCPVRAACAQYAIERRELEGIWGGLTDRQRAQLRGQTVRPLPSRPTCGTSAGVTAHKRAGEPKCEPCKDADNAYKRQLRARAEGAA